MDDKTQSNLKKSFEQIPLAMSNILHATNSLDSITTDLKNAKVERIVDHIESLTKTLNNNSSKITSIIENLDNITDSIAKSHITQTIARVNDVLLETELILDKIKKGEGTVGMLLNDKKLYDHLVLASADLDFLLLDLKQNPGRYLNVSLINFGSKRQKSASGWDSTDYAVLKGNALVLKKLNEEIKDKKILQKIILCDVQKEIYPELEKALLNLLHTSGYPNIKFEKKVDFDELYKKQFN